MSDRWKRWRCYMDELEDLLRWMAHEIDAAEHDAAVENELHTWPRHQRERRTTELARRLADMPFFGEVLDDLAGPALAALEPAPDVGLREHPTQVPAFDPIGVPGQAVRPPAPGERPPRRLVSAERALAERTRSLVPVFDQMTVPRNASAVIRTAEALGLQELHFVHAHGYVVPQRAVTKRCERWIDLHESRETARTLDGLRARGYRLLGADFGREAVPVEEVELTDKVALVMGSEQEGVSEVVRSKVDALCYIPTVGFTAYLNVSVAAAISLAILDRRLRAEGRRRPLERDELRAVRARWYRGLARGRRPLEGALLKWLHRPPVPSARGLGGRS